MPKPPRAPAQTVLHTTIPFDTAAEVWFWFVQANQARLDGAKATGAASEAELQSLMRDPKYWRDKDPATIAKVTDGFKRIYGSN